ncbi:MAG: UDP-2,3-diacylglucosamine diphosphatase [bacterium]|nr:UDP-2,3-diacylglucosamine diphosphatase [bacterium]
MPKQESAELNHYRSVFISDIHLGTPNSMAEEVRNFLSNTRCDNLYLVGDVIDLWMFHGKHFWSQSHNNVLRTILGKAKHGTRVVYIPGNHDDMFRRLDGVQFGNISIQREAVHETADGRTFLLTHGDEFDAVVKSSKLVSMVGAYGYGFLQRLNRLVNWIRGLFGLPYWSLAKYVKRKVKNAVAFISKYEKTLMEKARVREVDGIICGHIHHSALRDWGDLLYCNTGDWVESGTAIVEHFDGRLELLDVVGADDDTVVEARAEL